MNIPQNEEHWEAGQADVNRKKEALIDSLPEESRARIFAMEEACRLLEAAKVPFVLFASPDVPCKGVMQYNRETYVDRFSEQGILEGDRFFNAAIQGSCEFFATIYRVDVEVRGQDGRPWFISKPRPR